MSERDITIFDSTGLAIQDPAIALAAIVRAGELDLPTFDLNFRPSDSWLCPTRRDRRQAMALGGAASGRSGTGRMEDSRATSSRSCAPSRRRIRSPAPSD